ncbi:MAG: hypothetical protein IKV85_05745 [Ruminococcus sp.]|nr:hypothetical protein [Ruminococcus sp.]
MEKGRNVQRRKIRKKGGPKLKFKFSVIFTLFFLSVALCFLIYMFNVNVNDSFLKEEFGSEQLVSSQDESSEASDADTKESESETVVNTSFSNPVPQSETMGSDYFSSCSLITDNTLADMAGIGFGGDTVFGGKDFTLSAVSVIKQESSFGNLSPYEIIKQKKPASLYLMFGAEIETTPVETVIEEYSKLIDSLKSTVPEMKIYVMEYPPVIYDTDALSNEKINDYNSKLVNMCDGKGVYCIDTNTALKSEAGKLDEKYWSYETLTLSQEGFSKVSEYILNHVVQ